MSKRDYLRTLEELDGEIRRVLSVLSGIWLVVKQKIVEEDDEPTGPIFDGGLPTKGGMGDFDWDI